MEEALEDKERLERIKNFDWDALAERIEKDIKRRRATNLLFNASQIEFMRQLFTILGAIEQFEQVLASWMYSGRAFMHDGSLWLVEKGMSKEEAQAKLQRDGFL